MDKLEEHFDWAEDVAFDIADLKEPTASSTTRAPRSDARTYASVSRGSNQDDTFCRRRSSHDDIFGRRNSSRDDTFGRRNSNPASTRPPPRLPAILFREKTKEQQELMKQKIEAARRRKEEEFAEEEARKQERIRVLLEGLDLKKKRQEEEQAKAELAREQERERQREIRRREQQQRQDQLQLEQQAKPLPQNLPDSGDWRQRNVYRSPRAVPPPTGPAAHGPSLDSIQALQSTIQRKLSRSPDAERRRTSAKNGPRGRRASGSTRPEVPTGPKRTLMRRPAVFTPETPGSAHEHSIVRHYTTTHLGASKPVVNLNLGLERELDTPVGSDTDEATPRSAVIYSDFAQGRELEPAVVSNSKQEENDREVVVDVPNRGRHLVRY
ncbi:hypothetical protein D0Z00_002340 [Geotrichum galactomycetum]|uniref:Uncharacterized protein n=1 Tax=Geotrichum galactomycetum TaxID=27317 RepID=A0ACB6V4G0_9ASCO|nr:hypothetical protein D0Z00_002340 [Geotrichum candidum]